MSREVCGICWCPYDENTGECACAPQSPTPPYEAKTEAEITAYCAGWWDALQKARNAIDASKQKPLTEEEISNIWDGHVVPVFGKNGINPIVFARAIERAHGITP